ncbi:MAG: hypothetical protein OEX11_05110 [Nitrosomonas sp.]|nr:hypothetical protein [Nitrosomonas sp.]
MFISRLESVGEIAPYRNVIPLTRSTVQLRRSDHAAGQTYWEWLPENDISIKVTGPARYALEHRFVYPETESKITQTYRIHVSLDDEYYQTMAFETAVDSVAPIYVNWRKQVIGRLETGYIDIPAGEHLLKLDSTARLYGRLLLHAQSDYLLPSLNQPAIAAVDVTKQMRNTPKESSWLLDQTQIEQVVTALAASPSEQAHLAQHVSRDNRYRDGGMQASMLMQNQASKLMQDAEVQNIANRTRQSHTFYRDILPVNKIREDPQSFNWFITRRLHKLGGQGRQPIGNKQHEQDLLRQLGSGFFIDLPDYSTQLETRNQKTLLALPCDTVNCYNLPVRSEPGLLRVVTDLDASMQGATFMIQFEDNPPVSMYIDAQTILADEEYISNSVEAGLRSLQKKNFVLQDVSASSMIQVGEFEFVVPTAVRQVRLWRSDHKLGKVKVALQYRASKRFILSETEYLEMVRRLTEPDTAYDQFLRAHNQTSTVTPHENELNNHWLPLLRFLRSEHQAYTNGVTASIQPVNVTPLSQTKLEQLRMQALMMQNQQQWLVALELWTQILHGSDGLQAIQRQAKLGRIEALQHLGAHFFMEQQLRGLLFHSKDHLLQDAVFKKLVDYYRGIEDIERLQQLLAAVTYTNPTTEYLSHLSQVLLENGRYDMALMVGLIVPLAEQPVNSVLHAAFRLGWWQVYESLLAQITDEQTKHFWRAQRSIEQGNHSVALEQFGLAGEFGAAWFDTLKEGLSIRQQIISRDFEPEELSLRWQRWQTQYPGPFNWHEAKHLISDYAGAVSIYNQARDTYFHTFKSDSYKVVKLRFAGPIKLRIEARPIHTGEATIPVSGMEGWLHVRGQDGLRIVPITQNLPVSRLSVVGDESLGVGSRVSDIFSFGPGLHEIEVSAPDLPVLVRVFEERPEFDLGVLPRLNVEVMENYFGPFEMTPAMDALVDYEAEPNTLLWSEAMLLAQGKIEAAIKLYSGQGKQSVARKMTLLLWLAEQVPERYSEILALGEALAFAHTDDPYVMQLLRRLSRNSEWLPISNIQTSAGLRFIEVNNWQPENPAMRIRKTLLSPLRKSEQIISGTNHLVVGMNNLQTAEFEVTLLQEDVQYLVSAPMIVFYQIDNSEPVFIQLTPQEPQQIIKISIPEGEHTLRFGIDAPVTNQFLRVHLKERGGEVLVRSLERAYHVATQQRPIEIGMAGPAWLRIDKLQEGVNFTQFHYVETGWQKISVKPDKTEKESLVRIAQKIAGPKQPPIPNRQFNTPIDSLPLPRLNIQLHKQSDEVVLHDGFSLGGQEDGSWSINFAGVSRRNFGDVIGNNQSERFFESSLTHRYYHENSRIYFKTDLLGRSRERGEPTFGIKESIFYQPLWAPVNFKLDGSLYTQQFRQVNDKDSEWTGFVQASVSQRREISPKTWHVPELSYFYRALSLDANTGDNPRLDQDIFTQYKADHLRGLRISETFLHRPWLDTLWHSNVSVVTNENGNVINPDHIRASAGWRQLIGGFEFDARYQFLQFFSDKHRNNNFKRHSFMTSLSFNQWRFNQQRVEIGIKYRRDFDISSDNGLLYLSWHFGRGRMYRDFLPGEINFKNVRQLNIPHQINNSIKPVNSHGD